MVSQAIVLVLRNMLYTMACEKTKENSKYMSNNAYRSLYKVEKNIFERGIRHIILRQRHINRIRSSGHDMQMDMISFIPDMLAFMFIGGVPLYLGMETLTDEATDMVKILFFLLFYVYIICAFALYIFDMDCVECYFLKFKKSSYYLATGVRRKDLRNNKGLVGEFKAYVLSRILKVPHKVLYNVCVPMQNGNFQEIDALIITRKMIYVLECKNNDGKFIGKYTDDVWQQILPGQQHNKKNIYLQNQGHTMALDYFLLKNGIIHNGQNVCINMALISGSAEFPSQDVPMDFRFGNVRQLAKFINTYDKKFCKNIEDNGIMDTVYDALLPYALYTNEERANMVQMRDIRSQNGEFHHGNFRSVIYEKGIPGVTPAGQRTILRYNRLYTQIQISDGKSVCWQTRTDIPKQYLQ